MITATRTSFFFSAWILAVTTTLIETEAFTTSTRPSLAAVTVTTTRDLFYTATARIPTSLSGKKKKKSGGGGGSATSTKIQVKLLHHIAGTGQAGDVILVNPIFFDNKLRPQKLARVITDEEVQAAVEKKQDQSDELMKQARAVKDLLDEETTADDAADASPYVLEFRDNQTGPDGKKLFGGIGPKKLMESLRNDCKEFDAYSKQFTKQVSIIDIEEQETVVEDDESSD
jgi:ribosomal protein L9